MNLVNLFWHWFDEQRQLNMAQYHGDGMDYVADDNEMAEVEDDMYFRGRALGETDSDDDDDDEYDPLVCF
jgi:hypothetical protein